MASFTPERLRSQSLGGLVDHCHKSKTLTCQRSEIEQTTVIGPGPVLERGNPRICAELVSTRDRHKDGLYPVDTPIVVDYSLGWGRGLIAIIDVAAPHTETNQYWRT